MPRELPGGEGAPKQGGYYRALSVPKRGAGLMTVLSTSIDALNLAAKGHVRPEVSKMLAEAQQQARICLRPAQCNGPA